MSPKIFSMFIHFVLWEVAFGINTAKIKYFDPLNFSVSCTTVYSTFACNDFRVDRHHIYGQSLKSTQTPCPAVNLPSPGFAFFGACAKDLWYFGASSQIVPFVIWWTTEKLKSNPILQQLIYLFLSMISARTVQLCLYSVSVPVTL